MRATYIPESIRQVAGSSFICKLYLRKPMYAAFPFAVNIELTNKCNLKCLMCPRHKLENLEVGDIDFELFEEIIDEIAKFANEKTCLTLVGLGEPLMYPHLIDAIEYVKMKCPKSSIVFDTNGTFLNEAWSRMLIGSMRKRDKLLISLNAGSQKTYKWLTGTDRYDHVVNNIKNFLAIRRSAGEAGPRVSIQILETKKTESEIEQFKKFWNPFGGPDDNISVKPLLNVGGKIETSALSNREKGRRYPCYSLWTVLSVDKEGNVYPCCEGFSSREASDLLLGKIGRKPLIDIYSDKIKSIRKKHLNSQWNDIHVCSACDSWSYHKNVWFSINKRWF
jgi:radical SAM protein with 4Fe4S-binding SPASM domain